MSHLYCQFASKIILPIPMTHFLYVGFVLFGLAQ